MSFDPVYRNDFVRFLLWLRLRVFMFDSSKYNTFLQES